MGNIFAMFFENKEETEKKNREELEKKNRECCKNYSECPKPKTEDELCGEKFPCPTSCGNGFIRRIDSTGKVGLCEPKRKPCGVGEYRKAEGDRCRDAITREYVDSMNSGTTDTTTPDTTTPDTTTDAFSINYQESNKRILEYILLILIFYLFYRLIKLKRK